MREWIKKLVEIINKDGVYTGNFTIITSVFKIQLNDYQLNVTYNNNDYMRTSLNKKEQSVLHNAMVNCISKTGDYIIERINIFK